MKKITLKIIASIALIASITGCDVMNNNGNGQKINGVMTNNDLIQPDYYYELDTWGTDADVFEFTMKSNPKMVVINVGSGKNRGIFVIPKGKQAKKVKNNGMGNPVYDTDHYYEIDTWGTNADVFEFTPRSNTDYTCVVVGGDHSMSCVPRT